MMPPANTKQPRFDTIPKSFNRMAVPLSNQQQDSYAFAIRMQRAAILTHCADMMRRLGRPVSLDEAARDWIPVNAEIWRARFNQRFATQSHGIQPSQAMPGRA